MVVVYIVCSNAVLLLAGMPVMCARNFHAAQQARAWVLWCRSAWSTTHIYCVELNTSVAHTPLPWPSPVQVPMTPGPTKAALGALVSIGWC